MSFLPLLAAIILFGSSVNAQSPDLGTYIRRCASSGKQLWGVSLCAPIVVVDPETGSFRTSQKAPTVPLPSVRGNTAIKWGGVDWIMVLDPLPSDPVRRAELLFHEAWHVRQSSLGLPPNNVVAGHLNDPTARYLIRMEWAALREALTASGSERRSHIAQALAFRNRRIGGHPDAATAERDHMRHEGLAAYTGTALSGAATKLALAELKGAAKRQSLARSFGYVSGPAWGLLLDATVPGWRKRLKSGADLPDLMSIGAATVARADDYGGTSVLAEEMLRGVKLSLALREAVHATAPERALHLPLEKMNMSFEPNSVSAAPDGSALYRTITLRDRWGEVKAEGSVLRIGPDYKMAFLPWPLRASDVLELAPGWNVEEQSGGGALLVQIPELN